MRDALGLLILPLSLARREDFELVSDLGDGEAGGADDGGAGRELAQHVLGRL